MWEQESVNLCLALFREKNIPIIGIIVNKVLPEKLEKVRKYVKIYLDKHKLPLLGVIPYDKMMALGTLPNFTVTVNNYDIV